MLQITGAKGQTAPVRSAFGPWFLDLIWILALVIWNFARCARYAPASVSSARNTALVRPSTPSFSKM